MDDKFNRRMHAYQNDVEYKGAEAFLIIWKNTSGFKWLSRLLSNKICIFFMYVRISIILILWFCRLLAQDSQTIDFCVCTQGFRCLSIYRLLKKKSDNKEQ